jgi:polyphenol oxidase
VEPESLIRVRQVHCAEVHVATEADLARGAHPSAAGAPVADAIVTNTPGLALMTLHADCLALLLADPYTRSIAAVHAGWRSTVADIVTATIQSMRREFGTRARDLIAFIGPSIGVDRYQVGSEVVDGWSSLHARTDAIRETDDGFRFDLKQANLERLVANGVPRDQIEVSEVCTASNPDDWFSHRGQGALTGRFAAIISIVDDGVLS